MIIGSKVDGDSHLIVFELKRASWDGCSCFDWTVSAMIIELCVGLIIGIAVGTYQGERRPIAALSTAEW